MSLRSLVRTIPPIARRDAQIAALKSDREKVRRQRDDARRAADAASDEADVAARRRNRARREADAARRDADAARHEAETLRITADTLRQEAETLRQELAATRENTQVLLGERDELQQRLDARTMPTLDAKMREAARIRTHLGRAGVKDPAWTVNKKDDGYRFARSHGFDVPAILARHDDPRDIDWSGLPDGFVVKTLEGSTSRGVIPLERHGGKYLDLLNVKQGLVTPADLLAELEAKHARGQVSRELVIEELLRSPYDDGRAIAPDIKLYCFYGRVGMIMIRDCRGSRYPTEFRFKFLDASGTDIGDAFTGRPIEPSLPTPLHLPELLAASELLSTAIPAPLMRLDFFERVDGIVFGETTLGPGGRHPMRPDVDAKLVDLWADAEARLRVAAIATGVLDVQYGDHPVGL